MLWMTSIPFGVFLNAKHLPYSQQAQTNAILFVLDGAMKDQPATMYGAYIFIYGVVYIVHVFELLDQHFAMLDLQLGAIL